MNSQSVSNWVQIAGAIGIIGGLVLVGFQLHQNSEILKTQVLIGESQSVIDQELRVLGENAAAVWAKAMLHPSELTLEEHRVMEAIFWSQVEGWQNVARLEELGLVDVVGPVRAAREAPYFFGNTYGRAWWNMRRNNVSDDLREVIDDALSGRPTWTLDTHKRLESEIDRLLGEASAKSQ